MADVPARRVANFDACEKAGDFYITPPNPAEGGMRRISFICPCGCGSLGGVRVRDDGVKEDGAWGWNRDEDKPTITPSIQFIGGCGWHGHLTAGVFKSV